MEQRLSESKNFKKAQSLPSISSWCIDNRDLLIDGSYLCFWKSKGWIRDHFSAVQPRRMILTKSGYLVVYKTEDTGFVLNLMAAQKITQTNEYFKGREGAHRRMEVKFRYPKGSLHVILAGELTVLWQKALTALDAAKTQTQSSIKEEKQDNVELYKNQMVSNLEEQSPRVVLHSTPLPLSSQVSSLNEDKVTMGSTLSAASEGSEEQAVESEGLVTSAAMSSPLKEVVRDSIATAIERFEITKNVNMEEDVQTAIEDEPSYKTKIRVEVVEGQFNTSEEQPRVPKVKTTTNDGWFKSDEVASSPKSEVEKHDNVRVATLRDKWEKRKTIVKRKDMRLTQTVFPRVADQKRTFENPLYYQSTPSGSPIKGDLLQESTIYPEVEQGRVSATDSAPEPAADPAVEPAGKDEFEPPVEPWMPNENKEPFTPSPPHSMPPTGRLSIGSQRLRFFLSGVEPDDASDRIRLQQVQSQE